MKPPDQLQPLRCLLVEDSEDDAVLLLRHLRDSGYAVTSERVETPAALRAALERTTWDLVISDYNMPSFDGRAALEIAQSTGRDIPFIVVSGMIGEDLAVETMRAGASDYVMKGRLSRLGPAVTRELKEAAKRQAHRRANDALHLQGAALAAAGNAIVITDREGRIQWVNPAFTALTGYTLDEAVDRNPRDLVKSGKQDPGIYRELWSTILAGRNWSGELINRRKDGTLYHEKQTISPVRRSDGIISHFIAIKQDLTERKQAEHALQESEARYRLVFDQNPLPMWVHDAASLDILAANEAATRHYGYSPDEFRRLTFRELHTPEDVAGLLDSLAHRPADGVNVRECRHRRKDGSVFHVEVFSRPLVYAGRPAQLAMAADITEKKIVQDKFLHAQRLESLGMLAAGIAHDLNNILAPILFAAPLLRDRLNSERDRKILDTLALCGARGTGLVKQILGFAGATSGEFQTLQTKHLVRDVIDVIEQTFPKSIALDAQVPVDLWPIRGDATQIHQVLLNLCVNARDAMPHGGRLSLLAGNRTLEALEAAAIPGARPGRWLVLEIADTGSGISPAVQERMWEAFFTTKATGKGTGLGLSTVRGIVASHHGFITLDTQVGQGTTFRVYLPAVDTDESTPRTGSPFAVPEGNGQQILVVEDDDAMRYITAEILSVHGFRVVTASDGVEAIGVFNVRPEEFALVVTDVDMPRLGGVALVEALRRIRPDIPMLAMSGLTRDESAEADVNQIQQLVPDFLVKPFKQEALLAAVHHLLAAPPRPSGS